MMTTDQNKRLFFAFQAEAPWPHPLPNGRILKENQRHLTVAFLGKTDYGALLQHLNAIPLPPFKLGVTGIFDKCLFLPTRHPNVVAWHVDWQEKAEELFTYQKKLADWLFQRGFLLKQSDSFLPHVTLSRQPFIKSDWENTFEKLPLFIHHLHLYESLGGLNYEPVWSHTLIPPFEEIDHTADIAFLIRGKNLKEIYLHAQTALSFNSPSLIPYFPKMETVENLDSIIVNLNQAITSSDSDIGCSLKAVSYHGEIKNNNPNYLEWEMIVDV